MIQLLAGLFTPFDSLRAILSPILRSYEPYMLSSNERLPLTTCSSKPEMPCIHSHGFVLHVGCGACHEMRQPHSEYKAADGADHVVQFGYLFALGTRARARSGQQW
jgi:hypothetical protein